MTYCDSPHQDNGAVLSSSPTSNGLQNNHANGHQGSVEMTPDCHPPANVEAHAPPPHVSGGAHGIHSSGSETSAWDAWIQLTKAYIGPGCLSLPWAVSQLGLPLGSIVIFIVAWWTSYNCWNVVELKRVIMKERAALEARQQHNNHHNHNNSIGEHHHHNHNHNHQQITYPDVGEWAYNKKFRNVLLVSVCVQQMAVCTVFLSFVGENIAAVMERTLKAEGEKAPSHALVITMALPLAMLLAMLPNLKVLSPVMLIATISLFVGFGLLGVVVGEEWEDRPRDIDHTAIDWSQLPMAICAILYSYEGICVILPVESAMAQPQHFGKVFVSSMSFTAFIFAAVACLCCLAFGDVTNGSVTAFLVQNLEDENVKWWLYMANTACSIAVLLTYPLQLFPSFELIGPWMTRVLRLDIGTHLLVRHHRNRRGGRHQQIQTEPDRSFSPVAPVCNRADIGVVGNHDYHDHDPSTTAESATSATPSIAAAIDDEFSDNTHNHDNIDNEAAALDINNANENNEEDEEGEDDYYAENANPCADMFPTPGDSPPMRAVLVCFTYILAIAVPNVQLLVSLAGALSGSATGLIIPPLLELAYVKRQETTIHSSILTATDDDDDDDNDGDDDTQQQQHSLPPISDDCHRSLSSLKWKKVECYTLFTLGVIVCCLGTASALSDIVRVYLGP